MLGILVCLLLLQGIGVYFKQVTVTKTFLERDCHLADIFDLEVTGRLVAMILGIVLMIVGVVVSLTLIGAIVGVPLAIVGLLLFIKGIF